MTTGGDDFISARVNFEIPAEASAQMREINTELERLRTNSDAAARSVDSFTRYIQLLNEAQERTSESSRSLAATMERMGALTAKGAQPQVSTAVPTGTHAQPWAGVTEGMGVPAHRTPAVVPQIPTGGAQTMLDQLAQQDPRAYLNARAAWGGGKQGELPQVSISQESLDRLAERIAVRDQGQQQEEAKRTAPARGGGGGGRGRASPQAPAAPWESWRDRVADWAGTAGTVAGAAGVGGRGLGGMVGRALQNWGAKLQRSRPDPSAPTGGPRIRTAGTGGEEPSVPTEGETEEGVEEPEEGEGEESPKKGGGQLGKLGKGLGIAGAGITAGVAAYGAYKKIGGEIQRYRALGQIRGGGFGEGFGYEMQARMMALNPFLTTQQSREIIQSALTQGYTGKEFDTVTAFMASNLKDMNMSVAESQKILQEGVHNSNESVIGLTQNLSQSMATMKALSQTGYNTLPERERAFESVSGGAIQAGASPQGAYQLGVEAGQEFSGQPGMADMGANLKNAIMGKPTAGLLLQAHGGPGGTPIKVPGATAGDPGSITEALISNGQFSSAEWNTIAWIAKMSHGNVMMFQLNMRSLLGVNLNRAEAKKMMDSAGKVGSGAKDDPLVEDQTARDQDAKARRQGQIAQGRKALTDRMGGPFGLGGIGGLGGANLSIPDDVAQRYAEKHGMTGQSESLDIEQNLVTAFGGHGFEVGAGSDWKTFDPTNADMLRDLKSGKIRVRQKGDTGAGSKLSDIPGATDRSGGPGSGDGRGGTKPSGLSGELKVTEHPANMRHVLNVPNYVPITSNEQAANAGYGNATKNNAPPGDGITSRGMRYG